MAEPETKTVEAWKPAVARIDVRDGNGGQAHGTGVLVTERLVLTALHVVGNRQADPPTFYDDGGEVVLKFPSHQTRGRVVRDQVSFSAVLDFALVECEHPPRGIRPLPLRDVAAAGPDALWNSFGFPLAAAQTGGGIVVEGNISDARGEYQGAEALQLYSQQAAAGDGAPVPGLSGGPVIVDGAVVGVLRSSLMADGGRNVAGTLFACPVRAIAERCGILLPPLEIYPGLPGVAAHDLPEEPFRYLAWYREEEAELFCGRNRELADVYQQLVDPDEAPLLLLYGQSGVGKSSFLAAGLLPRLKGNSDVHYIRRDREAALLGSILKVLGQAAAADGQGSAAESLAQVWRRLEQQTGRPLVVIADQVEEVYSRPSDRVDELEEMLAAAAALFRDRAARPRGRLVLSFRKEWYAEVAAQVAAAKLPRAEVFLRGLDRAGIVEVVRGLVDNPRLRKRYGLSIEDGLAEDLASDLCEDRGSPIAPTLQILLTKMWKVASAANRQAPRFDQALYQQLKRGDLLRDFLREQLAVVDRTHHEWVASGLVLDLLGQHVTEADTAGQRTLAELKAGYAHIEPRLPGLVGELKNSYLLVDSSEDRADHADATRLAHDTLALQVRRMLNESQAPGQRARRILDNRAVEWQGGALGAALDEADLRRVEQGRAGTRVLTPDEERLVQASTAARRARRRSAAMTAGVGGVLALLALGSLVATFRFWRTGQKSEASTRRAATEARLATMAALAEDQLVIDQGGTLTAVTAVAESRAAFGSISPAVSRALARVVQEARQVPVVKPEANDGVSTVAFLGGKTLLVVAGKEIRRWELSPWAPPKELDAWKGHGESISALATSADGERVASGDEAGNVVIWGKDGRRIGSPFQPNGANHVDALSFSPDGEYVAVGDSAAGTYLMSPKTGKNEQVAARDGTYGVEAVAVTVDPKLGVSVATATSTAVTISRRAGNGWRAVGRAEPDAKTPISALAFETVFDVLRLWSAEADGTVRILSFPEREGAPLKEHVFVRADAFKGGLNTTPLVTAGERAAVVVGAERVAIYDRLGPLLDELRAQRPLVALAYEPGARRLAYRDTLWAGLFEGTTLAIAAPYIPKYDRHLLFGRQRGAMISSGPGPSFNENRLLAFSSNQIVVNDKREAWVLPLGPGYNQGAREVPESSFGWAGCGLVNGKEVLVSYVPGSCIRATTWDGQSKIADVCLEQASPNDAKTGAASAEEAGRAVEPVPAEAVAAADAREEATPISLDVQGAIAVVGDFGGGVTVLDLAKGKKVAGFKEAAKSPIDALAHPRDPIITVRQDGFLRLRDWQGGQLGSYGCDGPKSGCRAADSNGYTFMTQSGDGSTLAAVAGDRVHVWFSAGGRGSRPKPDLDIGLSDDVTALAISPDGSRIACASAKSISLHDRAGQVFGEIPIGDVHVLSLAFDRSGQILASYDTVAKLRLWRANPDDWLKIACRRLAMSARWAEAPERAKEACESVRNRAMPSERIGSNGAD